MHFRVMVMIIHGFPNNISALRFEWAWQQPKVSRRLKQIPELQKKLRKESNFEYNFRILTEMLQIGPWNRLPLTVRWLADEFHREFEVGKAPPMHMPICFGRVKKVPKRSKTSSKKLMPRERSRRDPKTATEANAKNKPVTVNYDYDVDEYDLLVMKAEQIPANVLSQQQQQHGSANDVDGDIIISSSDDDDDDNEGDSGDPGGCVICSGALRRGHDFALRCLQPRCKLICHIECLAGRCLEPGQYVPVAGSCPICECSFLWGDLLRKANGCSDLVDDAGNTDALEVNDVSGSEEGE